MVSGRRESVIIFCVSPFEGLYLPAVEHYEPDQAYVFVSKGTDPLSAYENDLYLGCKERMACTINEITTDVHDFDAVLSHLMEVKSDLAGKYGDDLDIYIDISSGTHEFAAAGMFAAMVPKGAVAFTVEPVTDDLTKEHLEHGLGLIAGGLSFSDPSRLTGLSNKGPDDEMVGFLMALDKCREDGRSPTYRMLIACLKEEGIWSYDPGRKANSGKISLSVKEERYLKRHYIDVAVANGWVRKVHGNALELTSDGRSYQSVFGRRDTFMSSMAEHPDACYDSLDDEFECRIVSPRRIKGPRQDEGVVTFGKGAYRFRIIRE